MKYIALLRGINVGGNQKVEMKKLKVLFESLGCSNVSLAGNYKTIYIGGQNAIDENGNLIGKNDFKRQTEQVLTNIVKILETVGAEFENIIKFNIHIVQGQNPQEGFQSF